jgi:hypothetical protein
MFRWLGSGRHRQGASACLAVFPNPQDRVSVCGDYLNRLLPLVHKCSTKVMEDIIDVVAVANGNNDMVNDLLVRECGFKYTTTTVPATSTPPG